MTSSSRCVARGSPTAKKENSALIESLERYKIGVAAAQSTEEQARASLAQRVKERDDLQKTLDDTQAEVARVKVEHERLLARLEELRRASARRWPRTSAYSSSSPPRPRVGSTALRTLAEPAGRVVRSSWATGPRCEAG